MEFCDSTSGTECQVSRGLQNAQEAAFHISRKHQRGVFFSFFLSSSCLLQRMFFVYSDNQIFAPLLAQSMRHSGLGVAVFGIMPSNLLTTTNDPHTYL
jgi:hypothetical protein